MTNEMPIGRDETAYVLVAVERPMPDVYGATRVVGPFSTSQEASAYANRIDSRQMIDLNMIELWPVGTDPETFARGH